MALSLKLGQVLIKKTIKGDLRHKDYDRVTAIAKDYTAFVTGESEDLKHLVRTFKKRESDEDFQQRLDLMDAVTGYISNRLMTPMYKVGRTAAAIRFDWKDKQKTESNKKELQDVLAKYYGNKSVDDYLSTRMVELDCTDPNSFIVTDFSGQVNPTDANEEKARPYPFEVNSTEAIDYKYKNNDLQYLTVMHEHGGRTRYTMYLENDAIIADHITADEAKMIDLTKGGEIFYKDEDKKDSSDIYLITIIPHKAGKIPAVRIGARRDVKTRNRTFVPLIHPAYTFFKKSIKTISEFDMSQTLHTFPQKITYKPACPGDIENQKPCNKGKVPGGDTCGICKGSGKLAHTSAQDVIEIEMPDNIKDMVSLENFLAYKTPPIELLKFMKELGLDDYPDLAIRAVYCSELLTPDSTTTTATEKKLDLETVYDALKPFADAYSDVMKNIVESVAGYRDLMKDFNYEHRFPKDFKMKSLDELLDDLKKAKDSGAPSYIINQILADIEFKLFVDNPIGLLKIAVKRRFFPFNGKTEDQIAHLLDGDLVTRYSKVLYANFDTIFDELEMENNTDVANFYSFDTKKQGELVKAKVDAKIIELDTEQAATRSDAFGKVTPDPAAATTAIANDGSSNNGNSEDTPAA